MREKDDFMKNVVKMLCALALVFAISMVCDETAEAKEMINFPTQSQSSYSTAYARAIQVMLLNYYDGDTRKLLLNAGGADGVFGSTTTKVLKMFQSSNGLSADGICGSNTWRAFSRSLVYAKEADGYIYYTGKKSYEKYSMRVKKSTGVWYCYYGGAWYKVG
ncbi:MAG: peptidoglycan-binding protein [Clostridium sp.]|nr:peptidoglycan-binding protein [Clostridium sp.]